MSKKAQDSFQIRASLLHGKKIKFFQIFDFVLMENICTLMEQSFFTLFALSNPSINIQQAHKPMTRNPSSYNNPYSCKNFQET